MTFKGDKALSLHPKYVGSISIPEEVTYNKKRYRVTTIGDKAFAYCDGFTSVIFLNPIPPDVKRELFVKVDKSIPLYVSAESVEKYKAAEGWNEFKNIMAIPSKL